MIKKRRKIVMGVCDKHQTREEPYEAKVSSTVLNQRRVGAILSPTVTGADVACGLLKNLFDFYAY